MKKILLLIFVSIFIVSCSFGGGEKTPEVKDTTGKNGKTEVSVKAGDFKSLYGAYITAEINEVKASLKLDEIFAPKKATGDMKVTASSEQMGSFDAYMKVMSLANGLTSKVVFSDMKLDVDSKIAGKINASGKEFAVIQSPMQSFASFKELKLPENMASYLETIKKFEGKWIELPRVQDPMSEKILKNLLALKEKDIKDLIVKYPILKAKGEAKIEGTKNTFEAELDAENMLSLSKEMMKKLGIDKEMPKEEEDRFKKDIEEMNKTSKITLVFDTENHLFLDGKIHIEEEFNKGDIILNTDKNKLHFGFEAEQGVLAFDMNRENTTTKMDLSIKEKDKEEIKAHLDFSLEKEILASLNLNLDIPQENLKVEGKYENKNDKFNANFKVDSPEASANLKFDGTIKNSVVQTFNFDFSIPKAFNLVINTKDAKNDIMSGKFVFTLEEDSGAKGDISGDIGLGLGKEIFAFSLENLNINVDGVKDSPQAQMVKGVKFNVVIHGKQEKTDEKVELPSEFVSASEFQKAISSGVSQNMSGDDVKSVGDDMPSNSTEE